ncbi:MAG TPA: TolC family protein [Bryobacteraceae bacterium]|nr:TolC family protein [Bryobacteraceae bacterium]
MRSGSILTVLLYATSLAAQPLQGPAVSPAADLPRVSTPLFPTRAYFRKAFDVPPSRVELQAPVRLNDYIVDGKLELSLRSYLDLVLANNTDIAIQKLTVETSKNAILRAFSVFDPSLFANFNSTRTKTPANDALAGAATSNLLAQPSIFRYQQTVASGANYQVGFNTSKTSTNSSFALFNPALSANLNFNFTQPLLRNRGSFMTKLPITIARSRLRGSEYAFQDQLLRLVSQSENAYWDVILARENLRVQEQALALADTSLKRAQKELELGAISSLEIYQPQAQYANFEILVTQARFRLAQVEDVLRRQIGADLDPTARTVPIVLTESITPPPESALDKEALVAKGLKLRPDLKNAVQSLDVDDLNIKFVANQLRPDLSVFGQYGSAGRGGPFTQRSNVFTDDGSRSTIISTVPGGFGDALDQLFGFGFPVYGFGLTLRLPIRDRKGAADYADALVNRKLDAYRIRGVEQTVRLDVLNAVNQVESSRSSVELAKIALDLAQKRVDADQKRYDLGTITLFFLLDSQSALTRAQSDLVNQSVNYRKNLTNLLRFTGELLPERGIAIQ